MKLSEKNGETLTETLVSILIITLSSVILLTGIMAASGINSNVKKSSESIYEQMNDAENGVKSREGSVRIDVSGLSADDRSFTIDVYYSGSGELFSYIPRED